MESMRNMRAAFATDTNLILRSVAQRRVSKDGNK